MPYGATRRPLISTSVRIDVNPRSEMPDNPPVVAPDAEELTVAPELVIALTVCSSCSTLTTPVAAISLRVITCTGSAVSASVRLIDEPVISTRCVLSCASAVSHDIDTKPAHSARHAHAMGRMLGFIASLLVLAAASAPGPLQRCVFDTNRDESRQAMQKPSKQSIATPRRRATKPRWFVGNNGPVSQSRSLRHNAT